LGNRLGQYKVDKKSNEITVIPELLKLLTLADYVLAVKENHKTLYGELKTYLDAVIDEDFSLDKCDMFETTEKGHGRIETRRVYAIFL